MNDVELRPTFFNELYSIGNIVMGDEVFSKAHIAQLSTQNLRVLPTRDAKLPSTFPKVI